MPKKTPNSSKNDTTKNKEEINIDLTKIKEELTDYISDEIKNTYFVEIEKVNKNLIKEKNKKILSKNILIIILFLLIAYLLYLLYSVDFFSNHASNNNNVENTITEKEEDKKESNDTRKDEEEHQKAPTLNELKEEYSYLLNNVTISENSSYLKEYYNGNLTNELKNYLTLNLIDFSNLTIEEDYNIIEEEYFKETYKKILTSEYASTSFDYNDNKIRYINKLNAYITNSILKKESSNIKREIINIKVNGDEIIITTIEGLIKDGKLYNVLTLSEIENYKGDELSNYQDKLNRLTYKFKEEKLEGIEK